MNVNSIFPVRQLFYYKLVDRTARLVPYYSLLEVQSTKAEAKGL